MFWFTQSFQAFLWGFCNWGFQAIMWWLQIDFCRMGGGCLDDVLMDEIDLVWGLENERV